MLLAVAAAALVWILVREALQRKIPLRSGGWALIGAIASQILLARFHERELARLSATRGLGSA